MKMHISPPNKLIPLIDSHWLKVSNSEINHCKLSLEGRPSYFGIAMLTFALESKMQRQCTLEVSLLNSKISSSVLSIYIKI